MSCAEIIPKLELMADDELTSEQAAEVLSHIDDCSSCRDTWYGSLALRQTIKDRAASFKPANDFDERLIGAIRKEAWQARAGQRKRSLLLYAAAVLAAGVAAAAIYTTSVNNRDGRDKPVAASEAAVPESGARQLVAQTPASSIPASLDEAMSNFKQYLEEPGAAGGKPTSSRALSALSNQAGFAVKPMSLSGFNLSGAELVSAAPGKTNMVRLCYTRNKGTRHDSVICYQAASGKLVAKGLNEHMIDGRKLCCGEVEDKSVVFIPSQNGHENETLLVGTISKSDLMDLVLSSS